MAVGILEPQTHFGSVFLEVKKLFGVEGSTSLPTKSRGGKTRRKKIIFMKESKEHTIVNTMVIKVMIKLKVQHFRKYTHLLSGSWVRRSIPPLNQSFKYGATVISRLAYLKTKNWQQREIASLALSKGNTIHLPAPLKCNS